MIFHKSFEYADLVLNKYFLSTANNFFFRNLLFFVRLFELVEKVIRTVFERQISCNFINVSSVTFDQFNALKLDLKHLNGSVQIHF